MEARCLKCGSTQQVKTYESINISKDPSLKEKVLDGSLFTWTCPHCGAVNLVTAPTLYHDPEGRLMVWLMPQGALTRAQAEAVEKSMEAVSLSIRNDPSMDGYTLRRVDSVGDLIVRGVKGEFYPVKPDVFMRTYEPCSESEVEAYWHKRFEEAADSGLVHVHDTAAEGKE